MIYKNDNEVVSLVKSFEERTLSKEQWTHAAHLTVGFYYSFYHPFGVARNLMRDGILWLNDTHGTLNNETSGYHETLTMFWLKTISGFLKYQKSDHSLAILANKIIMAFNDSELPFAFYSRERLFSPLARFQYVEPDLVVATRVTV